MLCIDKEYSNLSQRRRMIFSQHSRRQFTENSQRLGDVTAARANGLLACDPRPSVTCDESASFRAPAVTCHIYHPAGNPKQVRRKAAGAQPPELLSHSTSPLKETRRT